MACSKLENIWKIMKNHNYESLSEIQHDMLCSLCKKLIVNARSAPCGCRFCFSCISEYLERENKTCPGNTEDCKLEILNLDENILVDNVMNNKISKTRVKCPGISCDYVDELRKMEDHSRMCKCRSVACPYVNIGCDKCNISHDKVADHLQSEIMKHTNLLMHFITNSNNEMEILKSNNNKLTAENEFLRTKINEWKLDGEMRREEIDDLHRKCADQNMEIESLNEDIPALRIVDRNLSDGLNELKLDSERRREEIADLHRKYDEKSATIDQLNGENVAMRGNMERNQEEIADLHRKCADQAEQMSNYMQCGEYLWKLDKFSDKMADAKNGINSCIYSKSFLTHANGYKMCLRVDPDGNGDGEGTHLSAFFCLMKGEFDSILQWPFRHSVTLALINQRTGLAHVSMTAKYADNSNSPAYMQPTDRNIAMGFAQFISHADLSTNPDLMRNNEIHIKCSVDLDS